MKTVILSCLLLAGLAACANLDDAPLDETETAEVSQEIVTGCGTQPPCQCALKGTPQCADPDNDSVPNMNDNCDLTYNPNQADCDGDRHSQSHRQRGEKQSDADCGNIPHARIVQDNRVVEKDNALLLPMRNAGWDRR